ncbi:hypothetical protein LQW54_009930 [Pestalotiopsis sp. IQ-011]
MSCFRDMKPRRTNIIRPAGTLEAYQSAAHLLGFYHACAVTCRYVTPPHLAIDSKSPSLEDVFERALALTILEHSFLQVALIDEDSKKPQWTRVSSVDFRNHLVWQTVDNSTTDRDELLAVLHDQHDRRFRNQDQQPLWRIVLLRDSANQFTDVVFAWNHAIADGMSGKIFHRTLLQKLELQSSHQCKVALADRVLELPRPDLKVLALSPPLAAVVKLPLSARFLLSEACKGLRSAITGPRESPYAADGWAPIRPDLPNKTRLRLVSVPNDALGSVLRRCREHGTTLTALLHALALASFAARLLPDWAPAFACATPFELRRFFHAHPDYPSLDPRETMGNYVSSHEHRFTRDVVAGLRADWGGPGSESERARDVERRVWAVSREYTAGLTRKLIGGLKNEQVGLMGFVPDWRAYFREQAKKPRGISWEVSNLGVLDGKPPGSGPAGQDAWVIGEALFTQSTTVTGAAFLISPISVKGGGLFVTFSWQNEIMEESVAMGVATDIQDWLGDIAAERPLDIDRTKL